MSSSLNAQTSHLASRLAATAAKRKEYMSSDEEETEEDIFAELEAEIEEESGPGAALMREYGMTALKQEIDKVKNMKESGYGKYTEITDERAAIRTSASEPRCVIHFYHTNFKRCAIMDAHLEKLAPKYFSTLFIRVFVENVPWLVERLGIKVLPCLMTFMNGVSKDKLIGFEELGGNDTFLTGALELRLAQSGVLAKPADSNIPTMYGTSGSSKPGFNIASRRQEADDGSDLDI